MPSFIPHSEKQTRAIFNEKRILVLGTGTQWGKTQVGGLRMKLKMHTYTRPDDNFLVTAPNYKIMAQSTLPAFLRLMEGWGTYSGAKAEFKMNRGGTCFFRTETDPDSVVGIPNVRHVWGDEAGKYRLYFWENIQARADATGASIDLTTSPYARNWIYKELIKPFNQGVRTEDLDVVSAASWENPYHFLNDPENLRQKRLTMDPRRFAMIYGGEFGSMAGLVYDCWDDDYNLVEPFAFPVGTRFVGGVDWGYYPDPFVLKIRAITPDGMHYGISEFVKNHLTITDIIQVARQKKEIFGIKQFYCDPSQPGYIEEFNRNGLTAIGADNDIRRGIDLHYELIKTRRYKEFRGLCPHSLDERESYHYPEPKELGPDDKSKELLPADQNNHCMDADRYITMETYRTEFKRPPKLPGDKKEETQSQRLARLKRDKRHDHAERWDS